MYSVKYQGQFFTEEIKKPNPKKILIIKHLALPQDLAGVHRFCNNYLRKYKAHLFATLNQIKNLMNANLVWDPKQQDTFELCK